MSVAKLYGNTDQYNELHKWLNENFRYALRYMVSYTPKNDGLSHYIALFPQWVDAFLLSECPFDWVVSRIIEQYDLEISTNEARSLDFDQALEVLSYED